jgi:hypothetical protein
MHRLFRTAKWRKMPASSNQKQFIAKRWGLAKTDMDAASDPQFDRLTKGEAANIITRLKHGAQVRILIASRRCLTDLSFQGTLQEQTEGSLKSSPSNGQRVETSGPRRDSSWTATNDY